MHFSFIQQHSMNKHSKHIFKSILLISSLFISAFVFTQELAPSTTPIELVKKGTFYVYWGWNRSLYTNSDISFQGPNYDFTLEKVAAADRPSPL